MNWLTKHKVILLLIIFFLFIFAYYARFNLWVMAPKDDFFNHSVKFSSPDETANYFWIKQFAQGQPLYYYEELNGLGTNLIHLRSVNTVDGKITPGSFLGMTIIYGSLAKVFGLPIIPYLTPFFSVLGLIFFYLIINYLFKNKSLALISALLLSIFPAWIYYSARGMYHNILYLSLLIIGLYFLFKLFHLKNPYLLYFLSGLLIGFSIITRTSEVVWIIFTVLFIFISNFKRINWAGFILFLSALWLPALLLFYHNQILYGAFISAGYRAIIPAGGIGEAIRSGILFQILVTPFGFNIKSILLNTFNYLYQLLPYWSAPAIFGAFLFTFLPHDLSKIKLKTRINYLIYLTFITFYLLVFYGSWQIIDRIDNQSLSLGTSYLRYWLPIYLLAMPFIAFLIYHITKLVIPNRFRYKEIYQTAIGIILILLLLMPSLNLVFRKTDESLFLQQNLSTNRLKSHLINQIINPDDVILIYKQADKIFFPERKKIITDLVVPADYAALASLAKIRHIYYYTFAPPSMVADISTREFEPHGLTIEAGIRILAKDWLYQINPIISQ